MIKHKKQAAITVHLENLWRSYTQKRDVVAFDVETYAEEGSALEAKNAEIFAYVLTWPDGTSEIWRVDTDDADYNEAGWNRLRAIFSDGNKAIIAHNYKYEYSLLQKHKIDIHPDLVWHDTMLMSRILRNLWPSHALDFAPWVLCGYTKKWDEIVARQQKARGGRFDKVDETVMYNYQICDGERTMLLYLTWIDEFENNEMLYKDYLVELELVKTTIRMESFGIRLDWNESNALVSELENNLDNLNREVFAFLGEYVNLNSDIHVRRLFYRKFKFPIVKYTKKGHKPAVDKDVIKALKEQGFENPILDMVLKSRTWSNGLSMIRGYQERANPEGIIFPTINSCQAKTRRQSGENPNMQNVSKEEKLDNPFAVPARKCFRSRSGAILIFVDYSGIEMRLMIGRSSCQKMIDILNSGGNVHEVACKIFYQDRFRSKVLDKTLYDCGKNAHFALPYGASPIQVGRTLKFADPLKEGLEAFLRYAAEFPEIAYLSKTVAREVLETCYVQLPFGSKLYVPISKAYTGLNYLIQGTAALILKRAEILVDKYFKEQWDDRVRLILPIHDELVIHFPRDLLPHLDEILYNVSILMTDMPEINIPLEVEYKKTTSTWNRAKGYKVLWPILSVSKIFGVGNLLKIS